MLPLPVLAALVAAWFALGLNRDLNWQALGVHQADLHAWVAADRTLAAVAYVALYALLVALSLPLGGVLTVAGGLLFGAAAGSVLAVLAASLGACLLFLLARGVLAPLLTRRADTRLSGPRWQGIRDGLRRDGFAWLLALRLIPLVPFWLSNLAPALAGMRLAPFAAATLIGIVPATTVLAGIGAGVGGVLARGGTPDLSVLASRGVLLPLLGLAALSVLPVLWRRVLWRRRRPLPAVATLER